MAESLFVALAYRQAFLFSFLTNSFLSRYRSKVDVYTLFNVVDKKINKIIFFS